MTRVFIANRAWIATFWAFLNVVWTLVQRSEGFKNFCTRAVPNGIDLIYLILDVFLFLLTGNVSLCFVFVSFSGFRNFFLAITSPNNRKLFFFISFSYSSTVFLILSRNEVLKKCRSCYYYETLVQKRSTITITLAPLFLVILWDTFKFACGMACLNLSVAILTVQE